MNFDNEAFTKAVIEAAAKIRTILAGEGVAVSTLDQAIGAVVEEAVVALGGNAAALLRFTDLLSREIPVGARRLRDLYFSHKRERILSQSSARLFGLIHGGDAEADAVEIGRRVCETVKLCGGTASEMVVLEGLAARLDVSTNFLNKYKDIYLVADLGSPDLGKLFPLGCPAPILSQFTKFLKMTIMPWQKKALIISTARKVSRNEMDAIQAANLVSKVIKTGALPCKLIIRPLWHHPSKQSHKAA